MTEIPFEVELAATRSGVAVVEALKQARLRAGLSQNELARRSGLNQRAINFIERGLRQPSLLSVTKLLAGLDAAIILLPDGHVQLVQREIGDTKWARVRRLVDRQEA